MTQRAADSSSFYQITLNLACIVLMSLALWGCSTQPAYTPEPAIAPPPPPVVAIPHPAAPTKVTTASWYGPGLQGHPTTSGEVYNQHALTAASRTLPLGSHAKVTNLKTGKSVVVRINDRGPFVHGRGIDLSRAAAKKIGIVHGTAKVAVTRVDHASDVDPDTATKTATANDTSPAKPANDAGSTMPPAMESSVIPTSMGSDSKESPPPAK